MRFFLFIILFFLTGCSNKINLTDFRPYFVPKSPNAPKNFTSKIKKISIVKFPKYLYENIDLSKSATYEIITLLQTSRFVKILRIIDKSKIKDEIKAAEIAKETNSDIGADYLIKGTIINATYTPIYHKGFFYYIKNKKGEKIRKYSPPYYSYEACVNTNIQILKLPSLNIKFDQTYQSCEDYIDKTDYLRFYSNLLLNATKKSIFSSFDDLKKFFAPKGYIYEVRKNDDKIIAKITLGKNQGMSEGLKLNIYEIKTDKITGEKETYKIGEAKVSNIIFDNSCWIIIDDNTKNLKIGDFVKPNFETSFWDIF